MSDTPVRALGSLLRAAWGSPKLLLSLTALIWGGNGVAGRLAVGQISPMTIVFLRWAIACAALSFVARADLKRDLLAMRPAWPYVLGGGVLGLTAFNALFYLAAHRTTAVNLSILQGLIPVFVIIGGRIAFGQRVRPVQALGVVMTLLGVVVVGARGRLGDLAALQLNEGDLMMVVAAGFYAIYALLLRKRPPVSSLSMLTALSGVALVASLPLVAIEVALGDFIWRTNARSVVVILYVGIAVSLVSQVFFIRGVQLIGPERAGVFVNLVPVFGALLAVIILGESLALYHAVALVLVVAGIWIAERAAPRKAAPAPRN